MQPFFLYRKIGKLFSGLFHKPQQSKQATPTTQPTQTQQNANNISITTIPLTSSPPLSPTLSSLTVPSDGNIINGGSQSDQKCTPGATSPSISQDNIKNTICVSGFTKIIRPPVSYTTPLKRTHECIRLY